MNALVCDFDGTLTRHDFYGLTRARWWSHETTTPWDDYLAGRITHFDALNLIFARVRGEEADIRAMVDQMELDPTVPEAFRRLHEAGWSITIASAGCEWYISHLLSRVTTPFTLYANPGRFSPATGLVMTRPTECKFYSPGTGIDKVAVVRDALAKNARVAFAGDGPPDLPAAKLVAPEQRFARGWLADALKAEGQSFHPLVSLESLAKSLL
jgi:2,3-diketo-5-methylthio-1-phosphopentane phosphatase